MILVSMLLSIYMTLTVIAVVGSKIDLRSAQANQEELASLTSQAKAYAEEIHAIFAETSAKTDQGYPFKIFLLTFQRN